MPFVRDKGEPVATDFRKKPVDAIRAGFLQCGDRLLSERDGLGQLRSEMILENDVAISRLLMPMGFCAILGGPLP